MDSRPANTVATVIMLAVAGSAGAAQRTFVASYGIDTNPCSVSAPCRGFAAAIAAVDAGGEVVALDSAGYGAFAVAKSATVTAPAGVHAAISVFSGTGVTVTTASDDRVVLRGLTIVRPGAALPTTGIRFEGSGTLVVDGVRIEAMKGVGIEIVGTPAGVIVVRDCLIIDNQTGINAMGPWVPPDIRIERTSIVDSVETAIQVAGAQLTINDSRIFNRTGLADMNARGVRVTSGGSGPPARTHISNSLLRGFIEAVVSFASPERPSSTVISRSEVTQNKTAVAASGAAAIALHGSTITHNETALVAQQGGAILTSGNNYVAFNATLKIGDGTFEPPSGNY